MNYSAVAAAIVAVGSMVTIAVGQPALAVIINNPTTATDLTALIGAAAGLISAFSPAIHKPA